jgi:hypothetical protein
LFLDLLCGLCDLCGDPSFLLYASLNPQSEFRNPQFHPMLHALPYAFSSH